MIKVLAAGTLLIALPSAAGAWEFNEGEGGRCILWETYEDGTTIGFGADQDAVNAGIISFQALNADWSIEEGEAIGKIRVEHDDYAFWHDSPTAVEHGFLFDVRASDALSFLYDAHIGFVISRNGKDIAVFDSDMTSIGWKAFEMCYAKLERVKRDREHQEQIDSRDKDPFDD